MALTTTLRQKSTVTKPPEPIEEDYGGGQERQRVVAPAKNRSTILEGVVGEIEWSFKCK
jgi:hypothetical protein